MRVRKVSVKGYSDVPGTSLFRKDFNIYFTSDMTINQSPPSAYCSPLTPLTYLPFTAFPLLLHSITPFIFPQFLLPPFTSTSQQMLNLFFLSFSSSSPPPSPLLNPPTLPPPLLPPPPPTPLPPVQLHNLISFSPLTVLLPVVLPLSLLPSSLPPPLTVPRCLPPYPPLLCLATKKSSSRLKYFLYRLKILLTRS